MKKVKSLLGHGFALAHPTDVRAPQVYLRPDEVVELDDATANAGVTAGLVALVEESSSPVPAPSAEVIIPEKPRRGRSRENKNEILDEVLG